MFWFQHKLWLKRLVKTHYDSYLFFLRCLSDNRSQESVKQISSEYFRLFLLRSYASELYIVHSYQSQFAGVNLVCQDISDILFPVLYYEQNII